MVVWWWWRWWLGGGDWWLVTVTQTQSINQIRKFANPQIRLLCSFALLSAAALSSYSSIILAPRYVPSSSHQPPATSHQPV